MLSQSVTVSIVCFVGHLNLVQCRMFCSAPHLANLSAHVYCGANIDAVQRSLDIPKIHPSQQ